MDTKLLTGLAVAVLLAGCGANDDPKSREVAEWVLNNGGTLTVVGKEIEVKSLDGLPSGEFAIRKINLNDQEVKDEDLVRISALTNLEELSLFGTEVSDKGIDSIVKLTTLKELEISSTNVTDAGIDKLAALAELQTLFVRQTAVTEKAVEALKVRLEECTIHQ